MDCNMKHAFLWPVLTEKPGFRSFGIILLSLFCTAIIFNWPTNASAQNYKNQDLQIPNAEFGQIPDSLLQMESYPHAPSAPYIYAYKDVKISFEEEDQSIVAILNYHVRLKVFDEEARQASVITIPYYFQNGVEMVDEIRGYTYQPDGSRTPLRQGDIRTINLNTRYNLKEFNMPEVSEGSVIEYTYRKKRQFIEELPDFYLAHQAPTAFAKATIEYPRYLRYEVVPVDFDGTVRHVEQRIDTSSVPKVFSIPQPDPMVLDHWITWNVPAIEQTAYLSSINDYRGKLKFQLEEFGIPRQTLENSWDLVVARLRRNQNPLSMIQQNARAYQLGKEISDQLGSLEQAQDSIFRYVNQQARFSDQQGAFSETPDTTVLKGSLADQPAINQTLIAMLRGAGIEAWPLLISTREYGKIDRSFPSFFQFNGLLAYSQINGKPYFMDASFSHSYPNMLPVQSYNETGLLLKDKEYEWTEIRPENSIFSIHINLDMELSPEGDLSGNIATKQFGYPARLVREKSAEGVPARDILQEAMFDGYGDITMNNVQVRNLAAYGDSVRMSADFTIENYAITYTDGIDFRPLVVGSLMSNPFEQQTRELPVTLDAPEELDLSFQLQIPEGYSLGRGTQNQSIALAGAQLNEAYRSLGQLVTYGYRIDISRKQFEPEQYPQLLDLYERWVELSNMEWRIKRN